MEWAPFLLSFRVAGLATLIALPLGIAIALVLSNRNLTGRSLLDAVVTAPMVLPPTVLGYYLLVGLGPNSAVGRFYHRLTGSEIAFTVTGAVVAAAIGALPLIIKGTRPALEAIDPILPLAARTLGASRLRAFATITLPLAAPGILSATMLGFAKSLGDFGVTWMLVGSVPGRTETGAIYIYNQISASNDAAAQAMVFAMTIAAVLLMYGANRLTMRPPPGGTP